MWEATSDFLQVNAVIASVVELASNFLSFSEVLIDISQIQCEEEERSCDVTYKQGGLQVNNQPLVFKASVKRIFSFLEFWIVLMLTFMKCSREMKIVNDYLTLAVAPNLRIRQDCPPVNKVVEENKLQLEEENDVSESSQVATDVVSADAIQSIVLSERTKLSVFVPCSSKSLRCSCDFQHSGLNKRTSEVRTRLLDGNQEKSSSG